LILQSYHLGLELLKQLDGFQQTLEEALGLFLEKMWLQYQKLFQSTVAFQ
jgi:hypothetical protein